jgi:hypothetical protein
MKLPSELKPEQVTAVIDTREQCPLDLSPLQIVTGTLATGYYSVQGLDSIVWNAAGRGEPGGSGECFLFPLSPSHRQQPDDTNAEQDEGGGFGDGVECVTQRTAGNSLNCDN